MNTRRVALGIDAAWTEKQPSGIALAAETDEGWRLIAAHASYSDFHGEATGELTAKLLTKCEALCGRKPDLVAVDMPLSRRAITGRRVADDAVSRAYGGRKCGTHTPSIDRPGLVSTTMRDGFGQAGYQLCTEQIVLPGLIEVYPHPALLHLTGELERLPYKISKARNYWPSATPDERRVLIGKQWQRIIDALSNQLLDVPRWPPENLPASAKQWKAWEDKIDAVVCAWVGICSLEGRAKAFGSSEAAIWIPE